MKNISQKTKDIAFYLFIAASWISAFYLIPAFIGTNGFFGNFFETHALLKFSLIWVFMAHITIVAMSLNFHRYHTHQAIKMNKWLDYSMQTWLWAISSISKLDWVSVHIYHHAQSDTPKDPHSPKHKGLLHVFFLGAYDFSLAKHWPEVLKIRNRLSASAYEKFIAENLFLAPILLSVGLMFVFGPLYGSILAIMNFAITPVFAVGGVNALAHAFGYKNYDSKDESRNLGFLFFLNWIIAGELDHNNHHKFPKSPSFGHRWFEFDYGFMYVRFFKLIGLAEITGTIPNYHSVVNSKADDLAMNPLPTHQ
jgi:fatty-acid desaturase